jgi:Asp-tRNA(Asn)/Glu-tRNA(Gln) amidotransferase A subunit family amidase
MELSRREFLTAAAGAATLATSAPSVRAAAPSSELWDLSAVAAVAAMKRGDFSAETFASTLLSRCKAAQSLNAFITLSPDQVLESARAADRKRSAGEPLGPMYGLPIPVKDSVNTRDMPTTGGTRALRSFQPRSDAPLVARLREAGAVLLGKTNLHEISMGYTSANLETGAVRNPYDLTRSPGGSSGGSAAAVAARLAPLSVAEDTAGSIRVPAAQCGIVGFRPTTGRYPTLGVLPLTPLFDQLGPHARNVPDVILFDAAVTGEGKAIRPAQLRGIRLGVVRAYSYADLDPEVERLMDEAQRRLAAAGVIIVEVSIPDLANLVGKTAFPIIMHDLIPSMTAYLEEFDAGVSITQLIDGLSSDIKGFLATAKSTVLSDSEYRSLVSVTRPLLQRRLADAFRSARISAIVSPVTPLPPVPVSQGPMILVGGKEVSFAPYFGRNVILGSTAGLPGLVLPAGLTRAGLPVGIEFDGPAGLDRGLLALGLALEQVLGTVPPPNLAELYQTGG